MKFPANTDESWGTSFTCIHFSSGLLSGLRKPGTCPSACHSLLPNESEVFVSMLWSSSHVSRSASRPCEQHPLLCSPKCMLVPISGAGKAPTAKEPLHQSSPMEIRSSFQFEQPAKPRTLVADKTTPLPLPFSPKYPILNTSLVHTTRVSSQRPTNTNFWHS